MTTKPALQKTKITYAQKRKINIVKAQIVPTKRVNIQLKIRKESNFRKMR